MNSYGEEYTAVLFPDWDYGIIAWYDPKTDEYGLECTTDEVEYFDLPAKDLIRMSDIPDDLRSVRASDKDPKAALDRIEEWVCDELAASQASAWVSLGKK